MDSVICDLIYRNAADLILKSRNRPKMELALKRLIEELMILEKREREFHKFERRMVDLGAKELDYCCEVEFKDLIESFHQQIYVVISTIIAVMNCIGVKGKFDFPINSIERFLEYLARNLGEEFDPFLHEILEEVRVFRSEIVLHPQQRQLHDWRIVSYEGHYYIFYFIPEDGVTVPLHIELNEHLVANRSAPPFRCKSWYVSANRNVSYTAVCDLIFELLGLGLTARYVQIMNIRISTFYAVDDMFLIRSKFQQKWLTLKNKVLGAIEKVDKKLSLSR